MRRDNVEHLVLIGGPTDVVVEPSIVRQRVAQRPGQATPTRPQAAPAAPHLPAASSRRPLPPRPPRRQRLASSRAARPLADAEPTETPIPFPPRRTPLRASERLGLARRETTRTAMAASAVAASEPLSEPAVARRHAALEEDEQPCLHAAEPASARFAPAVHSVAEEPAEEPCRAILATRRRFKKP